MEKNLTNRFSKILKRIVLISFILFFCLGVGAGVFFAVNILPVSKTENIITYELKPGYGVNQVLEDLKEKGIIKNALVYKIYIKFKNVNGFQAGNYSLSKSMNADEIIDILSSGKNTILDTVSVTFIEGKRFPYYAKKIAENFDYTYDEVIKKTSDKEYLESLIEKYWFIEKDILNEDLYYPLEGYIFPDTYEFEKSATLEDILGKMLDAMDKNLSNYKQEIELTNKSIHSLLTMASMVELEAVTPDDRLVLAGVFENRIKAGWTLGSDVTTYYSAKKELTQSLTMSDLNKCDAYNTRGTCVKGLPVGPICSPSLSSIVGAITPQSTKYYYFVADSHNKLYFGVTEADHQKNIKELKRQGLWPE